MVSQTLDSWRRFRRWLAEGLDPEFVEKLLARRNASFKIHMKMQYIREWAGAGSWSPVSQFEVERVKWKGDLHEKVILKPEALTKNGSPESWLRAVKGASQHMHGSCNWSYQPTARIGVAKIPLEQLLDMDIIPREKLLRLVSANEGRYEGILAVSASYNWAVKLRQVKNVKDPLDEPSGRISPTPASPAQAL